MTNEWLGVDHVQLAAPPGSEDPARDFYIGKLGMKEIPKPSHLAVRGGVWFCCGDQQIHIGIEANFRPALKAHPALHIRDCNALRQQLTQAGVEVVDDEPLPGALRFYVFDPFGNRLEILQRLSQD